MRGFTLKTPAGVIVYGQTNLMAAQPKQAKTPEAPDTDAIRKRLLNLVSESLKLKGIPALLRIRDELKKTIEAIDTMLGSKQE